MKLARFCAVLLSFFVFASAGNSQQSQQSQVGDIWRWIPFDPKVNEKDAQIVRNTEYVSVKIQAAHVSYKSGFLENIKQIVVSSNVSLDLENQKVEGTIVNRTWQKSRNSDDFIPVNDLLAVLTPAAPTSVKIKVSYSGIGEDRFKGIFDVLSNGDVKTALNLSPAVIAKSGLVTSIIQKFLATPYTSNNPREVLSLSQGFVIYSDRDTDRPDSLREGYIVGISGNENKSADLTRFLDLAPSDMRFEAVNHILQTKRADGTWESFAGNSYVVLSVTEDSVRGIDESSAWFKKFSEAERTTEKLLTGEPIDKVKKDALNLWEEGSTLLSADTNYIEDERKSIRLKYVDAIQKDLRTHGGPPAQSNLAAMIPGVPANYAKVAASYDAQLRRKNFAAAFTVILRDTSGNGIPDTPLFVRNQDTGQLLKGTTNSSGSVTFGSVKPGNYTLETSDVPTQSYTLGSLDLQARENKSVAVKVADRSALKAE